MYIHVLWTDYWWNIVFLRYFNGIRVGYQWNKWTIHGIWQFHWDMQNQFTRNQDPFEDHLSEDSGWGFFADFWQKKTFTFFRSADGSDPQFSFFRSLSIHLKKVKPWSHIGHPQPQPWLQVDAARLSASEIVDALQQWLEAHGLEAGCANYHGGIGEPTAGFCQEFHTKKTTIFLL